MVLYTNADGISNLGWGKGVPGSSCLTLQVKWVSAIDRKSIHSAVLLSSRQSEFDFNHCIRRSPGGPATGLCEVDLTSFHQSWKNLFMMTSASKVPHSSSLTFIAFNGRHSCHVSSCSAKLRRVKSLLCSDRASYITDARTSFCSYWQ